MAVVTNRSKNQTDRANEPPQSDQRQILAFNTLSKLAQQFSNRPDFGQVNELLVLTLSGQFSAPNVFAMIKQPGTLSLAPLLYATGKFRGDRLLLSQELTGKHAEYFLDKSRPVDVSELTESAETASLGFVLSECGVQLVVPLLHNDELIGIIGLGQKATKKPFDQSDLDLLSTLVNTITPFLASSYLFLEIAGLNKWYRDILDSVGQGVFVFDSHFRLKKVNSTGFRILQTFKPQLVHLSSVDRAPIGLVFQDQVFGNWVNRFKRCAMQPGGGTLENMVASNDEIKRIYNVHVSPVTSGSVLETDYVITVDDITDQKESEHRLFELQKLADMGSMASSISHELNNFLGLILGGVEMTEIALKKDDLERVKTNLGKLKTSVGKMERFTTGLMDYSKLEARMQLASLNEVITDVLTYITAQRKFSRTRVLSELSPDLPQFRMDSNQIAQLLLNVLNNGADAINETGRNDGVMSVGTSAADDAVLLTVSDNGGGIKPEVKDKLFKVNLTTKDHGHGHGLVTCARIIKNHGADVTIDTEPGRGTTFTFRFPLSRPDSAAEILMGETLPNKSH
jgi:nitrogen-specific signal transduction histidine kinase